MTQEPASYTFHSNDIIATLEGLLTEFKQNKKDLDIAEFETKAQFDKNKLNMEHEKQFAEKDKKEKETISAEKTAINEEKKADREQETKDKNADQAFMDVLTGDCEKKAEQFDQRSKTRADELTAMGNALSELESGVQPNYSSNKKLVDLQRAVHGEGAVRAVSLLQRSSASAHEMTPSHKFVAFLVAASERLNSPLLSSIALKAQVQIDHFVKIRGIIKDLMAKLEEDAAAEKSQKSVCDKDMKSAISKRDEQNAEIEKLAHETSAAEAEKARLEEAIQDLADAIAALNKALKEATDLRAKDKAENEQTLTEASDGKGAVENAMRILSDFYKNAAFVQSGYVPPNSDRDGNTVGDLAPEVFDKTYHGKQEASKGIIGMLEVITSDFERTIDTVTDAEKDAQAAFEKYEADTRDDIDAKEAEKKEKETRVAELQDELTSLGEQTKDAKATLAVVLSELGSLKEMCVDGTETYEERVAKRKKEIEALKQAYKLLDDWQGEGVVKPAA
jgi:DNA repair exonuclease SbcCD ATPase subunit